MSGGYLDELERELTTARIPSARRSRIVLEFADHLDSDPDAKLGAPADIARQFADELGTSLARQAAIKAFFALAAAGITLLVMFLTGGRLRSWAGYGSGEYHTMVIPWWYTAAVMVWVVSAQVALAAGGLAMIRAYRLRRVPAISAREATILNRRAALGLIAGAITMLILPLTEVAVAKAPGGAWAIAAVLLGIAAIAWQLAALPAVLAASRLRPRGAGGAGDLTSDVGSWLRADPWRIAVGLSVLIVVVLTVAGIAANDPYDGAIRGIADGIACIVGFALLGRYLGLTAAPSRG